MSSALNGKPRLCVVGPLLGCNPGRVTSQGEILAAHFTAAGYSVTATSGAASRYVRLVETVGTLVRSRRLIDTVLLQVYGGPSFVLEDIASRLAHRFGHRIVMHLHGGAMPAFMARFPRWTRRVLSRADAFVAPSLFLTRAVAQQGLAASTIPNLIDLSDYSFRQRGPASPRLFWMRSFHSIYNPVMALRVLRQVRAVLPEATLTMGGQDKGLEPSLRREAVRMGVADAVRFVGFLDRAGKMREGEAADIFINTSRIDNTPVAIIEACAMGLPVVSTDVGGIRDLLSDGVSGLLVPDDDVQAMAEAILRLVSDPLLAQRLSTNGRRLAEASSWERVRVQWERLFAQLGGYTAGQRRAS
jgi:glycosyltransferase involved in cell wall biosynthesis